VSYQKLFKVTSDFALGLQTLNQALDNNRALYQQFDAKHSTGLSGAAFGDPFLGPGKHDDFLVARTVADYEIDESGTTPRALQLVGGALIFDSPEWITDGVWKIYITTPQLFGAVATVRHNATGDYSATARVVFDTQGPFVVVNTWDISSPTRINIGFSLVVWAQAVA
jgi:hypothetical protein